MPMFNSPTISISNYFSFRKSSKLLNADERKRHEFVDCLLVELLRAELLPFASRLPRDFMIAVIDILNRGSINTMDANDVLGIFLYSPLFAYSFTSLLFH